VLLCVIAVAGSRSLERPRVVGAVVLLLLGTRPFACLSMILASLVRTRERFMGIGQLVVMPLFFASSALYPLAIMPAGCGRRAREPAQLRGARDAGLLLGISAAGALAGLHRRRQLPRGHRRHRGEDLPSRHPLKPVMLRA
jgi:ABC-2 type transport system permease protein